jgi:hypothetical protein
VIRIIASVVLALLVSACSGGTLGDRLDEEKTTTALRRPNVLVAPPWEALVEAGPGAENEIDFETLNGPQPSADPVVPTPPPTVEQAEMATPAPAPAPAAKPAPPKPGEVAIRSVAVPPVKGQKAGAHAELTEAMRAALKKAGWPVVTAPRDDAITVQGHVQLSAPAGDSQDVAIRWDVTSPDGKRLGDLQQKNAIPAGSLDGGWGENATFAADAAAEGIFKLIQKFR